MAASKDETLSSDRETEKAAFLAAAGYGDASRAPLPGDASTRSYERILRPGEPSLMLMNAPPAAEAPPLGAEATEAERLAAGYTATARLSGGRIEAFVAAADYLCRQGLSAPKVVAFDKARGFCLMEDLGDDLFVRRIEAGEDETPLYLAAVEAVARLHEASPPAVLGEGEAQWPLLPYDALALKTGADLFVEWLPKFDPRVVVDDAARAAWDAAWAPILAHASAGAVAFTHRDYHAENLLWLPDREGVARVGLIDFQDCVLAHPSWDLHSLLQDARRDVSPELEQKALDHYFALRPGVDRAAFMADYAALAALNEARILGIFSRLVVRDGKPKYAGFMPRMWGHLNRNLAHPDLAAVRAWVEENVPAEARR
jgi:aminoglycoside/choline kinase family phosphotransferase